MSLSLCLSPSPVSFLWALCPWSTVSGGAGSPSSLLKCLELEQAPGCGRRRSTYAVSMRLCREECPLGGWLDIFKMSICHLQYPFRLFKIVLKPTKSATVWVTLFPVTAWIVLSQQWKGMCVCVCVCVCGHVCLCMCICLSVWLCAYMHVCACVCVYVHLFVCMHMWTCV